MEVRGKLFLTVEYQQINLEGMVKLENHKLVAIIVIDAGKGQQRMLKLVGEILMNYGLSI